MDLGSIFMAAATYGGMFAAAATLLYSTCVQIPQKHEGLITRFGKHVNTLGEGLGFKIPFIDKVEDKVSTQFQEFSVKDDDGEEGLQIKTSDDLFPRLPVKIQGWVEDTAKLTFGNKNPWTAISSKVRKEVRGIANDQSLQDLYKQDKDDVGARVVNEHREEILEKFGFHIDNIIIDEPIVPGGVQNSYNAVREEENYKKARITKAEGEAQAQIEAGKGVAGFRKEIFDGYADQIREIESTGVSSETAVEMVMETMRLDTLRDIGDKGNMVVVSPDNGSCSRLAELQTLGSTLNRKPVPEQDQNPVASAPAPGA